jgi:hypothetical protein
MGKAEELYELLREREECIWAISQASRLLNERWISLTTYKEITWRHVRRLAELSDKVKRKADELRRTIRKVSLEARGATEIQETKQYSVSTIVKSTLKDSFYVFFQENVKYFIFFM